VTSVPPATIEEVAVQLTGSMTAEAMGDGPQTNFVPRDGGNIFSGSFSTDFGNSALQGDNISPELRSRGAARPGDLRRLYDVGGGFGGPVARDRVWFFASSRYLEASSYAPGNYYNKTAGTLFYEPDLSRPAYDRSYYQELGVRFTIKAAEKHRLTFLARDERSCACLRDVLTGLRAEGKTILFSTHRMDQVEKLCDAICLIDRGKSVLQGSLNEIKSGYGRRFIQIDYDGDGRCLAASPLIDSLNDYGNHAELRLKPGADSQELLRTTMKALHVKRFQVMEPSLEQIFIDRISRRDD